MSASVFEVVNKTMSCKYIQRDRLIEKASSVATVIVP